MNEIEADDDLKLRFVVADTPERHFLKGIVAIAGIYSCECCTATALTAPIRWPADTTMNFPLRTRGEMLEATRLVCFLVFFLKRQFHFHFSVKYVIIDEGKNKHCSTCL